MLERWFGHLLNLYTISHIMTAELTQQEMLKFSQIMFQNDASKEQEVMNLSQAEKSKLRDLYAQKIAYEVANEDHMQTLRQSQIDYKNSGAPGVMSKVCCCFFPDQNRENFDITSSLFVKRVASTLMFFKGGFLKPDQKPELYGFLWLSITYVIVLGISSNLNEYFIMPNNYQFSSQLMAKALLICLVFFLPQPFIYSGVVKCLAGAIGNVQSAMLVGYSIALYFIPTLLCLIPSLYWHVGMLSVASLLRGVFLWRNYAGKVTNNSIPLLVVILLIEALFVFTLMRVMFSNDNGYGLNEGTVKVFKHTHQALRDFIL